MDSWRLEITYTTYIISNICGEDMIFKSTMKALYNNYKKAIKYRIQLWGTHMKVFQYTGLKVCNEF